MNYHNITKDDFLNGDGIRVVLWVAGCEHHCLECQNEQTWNYESGIEFDNNAILEIGEELEKDYVSGLTISGGDPLAPKNYITTLAIIDWVRCNYPDKTIWVYTGYTYEQLLSEDSYLIHILHNINVLVDGRYIKDLKDLNLKWRGSSNQRVIDVKKSLAENKIVLWCD